MRDGERRERKKGGRREEEETMVDVCRQLAPGLYVACVSRLA